MAPAPHAARLSRSGHKHSMSISHNSVDEGQEASPAGRVLLPTACDLRGMLARTGRVPPRISGSIRGGCAEARFWAILGAPSCKFTRPCPTAHPTPAQLGSVQNHAQAPAHRRAGDIHCRVAHRHANILSHDMRFHSRTRRQSAHGSAKFQPIRGGCLQSRMHSPRHDSPTPARPLCAAPCNVQRPRRTRRGICAPAPGEGQFRSPLPHATPPRRVAPHFGSIATTRVAHRIAARSEQKISRHFWTISRARGEKRLPGRHRALPALAARLVARRVDTCSVFTGRLRGTGCGVRCTGGAAAGNARDWGTRST
ncbi:hypothetical protein C2E23DRAFT_248447 [Lenzites betulinus]|nr:hypothetical protein C2E23DRAFT_248447 [Lenzites betulinus]